MTGEDFIKEVKINRMLVNPYIIRCYGYLIDVNNYYV